MGCVGAALKNYMTYKICWLDATLSKGVINSIKGARVARFDGEWYEFEVVAKIKTEASNLREKVEAYLDNCPRTIEVFSVIDEKGNVIMTEEDLLPA